MYKKSVSYFKRMETSWRIPLGMLLDEVTETHHCSSSSCWLPCTRGQQWSSWHFDSLRRGTSPETPSGGKCCNYTYCMQHWFLISCIHLAWWKIWEYLRRSGSSEVSSTLRILLQSLHGACIGEHLLTPSSTTAGWQGWHLCWVLHCPSSATLENPGCTTLSSYW